MTLTRRNFGRSAGALAGLAALGSFGAAFAQRADRMNILCWEGYNCDDVLRPSVAAFPMPPCVPKAAPLIPT